MTVTRSVGLVIVAAALTVAACADSKTTSSTTTAASVAPSTAAGASTTAGAPTSGGSSSTVFEQGRIDEGLKPYIDMAVADLARRLGVDPSAVSTLSAVVVVWPDSSLGCPQPGMSYTQVLVDGALIELGAGGVVYRYHSGGSTKPFFCDQPLRQPPSTGDS